MRPLPSSAANENAGRTGLTFEHRARAGTVAVKADGRLVESIAAAAKAALATIVHPGLPDLIRPAS